MIRRYGEAVVEGQIYTPRHGVYAILPRGNQVLLTYQDAPHFEFQLPGGGIGPGEHPIAALHREVFEETGWSIAKPKRLGAFRRFTYMPEYDLWAEKVCHIYSAFPARRHGPPSEPDHTAVWMDPIDAAQVLANEGDSTFLQQLYNGRP